MTRLRTLPIVALCALLTVAACGSDDTATDDAGSGDVSAGSSGDFCAEVEEFASLDLDLTADIDAAVAATEELRDGAPPEVAADLDVLIDSYQQVAELEPTDDVEADFDRFFAILASDDVIEAGERLGQFAADECGLEDLAAEPDDAETGGSADEAGAIEDPLFDEFFDGPVDPNEASLDGIRLFLDTTHPTAPWRPRLGSFSLGGGDPMSIAVGGENLTDAEAAEACAALIAYIEPFDPAAKVTVRTYEPNDAGGVGDEVDVIVTTVTDGC